MIKGFALLTYHKERKMMMDIEEFILLIKEGLNFIQLNYSSILFMIDS